MDLSRRISVQRSENEGLSPKICTMLPAPIWQVRALALYVAVDKDTGRCLEMDLHPSLPLPGADDENTALHLAAAAVLPRLLVSSAIAVQFK